MAICIYVVGEPCWFIADFDGLKVAVTHGSPWRYDTFVPMIFAGAGVTADSVYRRVETVQLALTLSAFIGIKRPSAAWAAVLTEVLEERGTGR